MRAVIGSYNLVAASTTPRVTSITQSSGVLGLIFKILQVHPQTQIQAHNAQQTQMQVQNTQQVDRMASFLLAAAEVKRLMEGLENRVPYLDQWW